MPRSLTNVLLGLSVAVALVTGTAAFGVGTPLGGWVLAVLHAIIGLVLVVLAARKSRIVRRGFGAGRRSRWGGAALAVAAIVTVLSGVAQAVGWRNLGPVTAIQVHVTAGIATGVGVVWHGVVHPGPWRRLRASGRGGMSRRTAVQSLGVAGLALLSWTSVEVTAAALRGFDGRRRFTGSQRVDRPLVTQWFTDSVAQVDPDGWRLVIEDAAGRHAVDLPTLVAHPAATTTAAVLDCTGGWYADTAWDGVPLSALVTPSPGDRSIEVVSVTGYTRRLPMSDLDVLVLATALDGAPLTPGHGAPARLVAPDRRGFWWVKWVAEVRTSALPWTAQPPFPLR